MALPDERFEICYLLDEVARARITPALRLRLLPCPLAAASGRQRVQSLYFGEPGSAGIEPRRRLRIRLHEASGVPPRCVVEIKHRVGLRSSVVHAAVALADAQVLAAGLPISLPGVAGRVVEEAVDLLRASELRPSLLVGHERLAMVGGEGEEDLRVTLDSSLGFRTRDLRLRPWSESFEGDVLAPGEALLVVKVARAVPHWLTLLLGRQGPARRSRGKHQLAHEASLRLAEDDRSAGRAPLEG